MVRTNKLCKEKFTHIKFKSTLPLKNWGRSDKFLLEIKIYLRRVEMRLEVRVTIVFLVCILIFINFEVFGIY